MYAGGFGNPLAPPCCQMINHQLHEDDIAGAQFVYGVRGDFDLNGTADAADYTRWRDSLGGAYSLADYDGWKRNFGDVRPTSEGAPAESGVPEPQGYCVILSAILRVRHRGFRERPQRTNC